MVHKKQIVVFILALLLLGTPLALVTAAGETVVSSHTPSLGQTAVRALLPYFADSDCDALPLDDQPANFDLAQPMPSCWLSARPSGPGAARPNG